MNFDQAQICAINLNENGKFKNDWFYYPVCHDGIDKEKKSKFCGEWFVLRRPKGTPIRVAVFANGVVSDLEKE